MWPNVFDIWSFLSLFTLHSSLKIMWFIVNTNKFQEQKTKEFLENTYSGIVKLVYLPKCRVKYVDTKGAIVR